MNCSLYTRFHQRFVKKKYGLVKFWVLAIQSKVFLKSGFPKHFSTILAIPILFLFQQQISIMWGKKSKIMTPDLKLYETSYHFYHFKNIRSRWPDMQSSCCLPSFSVRIQFSCEARAFLLSISCCQGSHEDGVRKVKGRTCCAGINTCPQKPGGSTTICSSWFTLVL